MTSPTPTMSFDEARRIVAAFEAEGVRSVRSPGASPQTPQDRLDAEAIRERFGLEEEP